MSSLESVFLEIRRILEEDSEGFTAKKEYIDSQAKAKKPGYHLFGSRQVSVMGRNPQLIYLGGVIQQKNYVSFYLSAAYSHPEILQKVSDELREFLKGKSCFNINRLAPNIYCDIEEAHRAGIENYRSLGWV